MYNIETTLKATEFVYFEVVMLMLYESYPNNDFFKLKKLKSWTNQS